MNTLTSLKEKLKKAGLILVGILVTIWLLQVVVALFNRGTIAVNSIPSGAEVYINGTKSGTTPFNSASLNPGEYNVRVSLHGYLTESRQMSVTIGRKEEISFDLTQATQATVVAEGSANDLLFGADDKLYFTLATGPLRKELWSYNPASGEKALLLPSSALMVNQVYWSADGRAVIVDWEGNAWTLSGGKLTKLPFRGVGFSWNPNGTELAFTNHRFFSVNDPEGLNIYNLTTGQVANIYSDDSVSAKRTRWSSDGTKILYFVYSDEGLGQAYVFNRDGSGKTTVLEEDLTEVGDMRWTSDSTAIYLSLGKSVFSRTLTAETREIFSLEKPLLIFDSASNGDIVVGSKESGEVWRVSFGSGKLIYEAESRTLAEVAVSPSFTAIGTDDKLFLLKY